MHPHHDLQIRVRYQETDAMGRLHHANYATYFELGRTEALRASGHTYREIEEQGIFLVVSELNCRFLRPANYDDLLTLRTTMVSARGARIEHEYQLFRGTLLLASGRTTVACVDKLGNVKRSARRVADARLRRSPSEPVSHLMRPLGFRQTAAQ